MITSLLSAGLGLSLGLIPKGVSLFESWLVHNRNVELTKLRASLVSSPPETPDTPVPTPPGDAGNPNLPDSGLLCPKLDCLKISIRPVITYSIFFFFLVAKFVLLFTMIHAGINTVDIQNSILDENTTSFLSLLIAFWFGTRTIEKNQK